MSQVNLTALLIECMTSATVKASMTGGREFIGATGSNGFKLSGADSLRGSKAVAVNTARVAPRVTTVVFFPGMIGNSQVVPGAGELPKPTTQGPNAEGQLEVGDARSMEACDVAPFQDGPDRSAAGASYDHSNADKSDGCRLEPSNLDLISCKLVQGRPV
jgi:hypothetical protein